MTVDHAEPKTREATRQVSKQVDDGNGGTTTEYTTETYTEHYTDYYSTTYSMERNDILKARDEEVLANRVDPNSHIDDLPSLPSAETR
ncbi:hypothetical protein, partial [Thermolongibacillus altinsuensis]|uniref:hypothetical protein n=1 Tax=Thermolongibacillus altinsuensis TaxID=575256 RepID=UPI002553C43E